MDKDLMQINTQQLISVVMAVFNGGKYLKESIESILIQSYENFEFIIINDGSTDSSNDIIKTFTDKRIKVLNNDTNKGLVASLNMGIAQAKGRFIARMDADDICLPYRLEKQLLFLQHNLNVGVCGCSIFTLANGVKYDNYKLPLSHEAIKIELLSNNALVHPGVMFRRSLFSENETEFYKNYKGAEDYDLWTRLVHRCQIVNLPDKLLYYRIHSDQVTTANKDEVNNATSIIKLQYLRSLGLMPTEEEVKIHLTLFNSQYKELKTNQFVIDSDEWMYKIYHQNLDAFDGTLFLKVWKSKLFVTSVKQYNLDIWRSFNKSWYVKIAPLTLTERTKIFIKCLINRKVG